MEEIEKIEETQEVAADPSLADGAPAQDTETAAARPKYIIYEIIKMDSVQPEMSEETRRVLQIARTLPRTERFLFSLWVLLDFIDKSVGNVHYCSVEESVCCLAHVRKLAQRRLTFVKNNPDCTDNRKGPLCYLLEKIEKATENIKTATDDGREILFDYIGLIAEQRENIIPSKDGIPVFEPMPVPEAGETPHELVD